MSQAGLPLIRLAENEGSFFLSFFGDQRSKLVRHAKPRVSEGVMRKQTYDEKEPFSFVAEGKKFPTLERKVFLFTLGKN